MKKGNVVINYLLIQLLLGKNKKKIWSQYLLVKNNF
jgi:hypothetical protein